MQNFTVNRTVCHKIDKMRICSLGSFGALPLWMTNVRIFAIAERTLPSCRAWHFMPCEAFCKLSLDLSKPLSPSALIPVLLVILDILVVRAKQERTGMNGELVSLFLYIIKHLSSLEILLNFYKSPF
jgi:hypothetical protein